MVAVAKVGRAITIKIIKKEARNQCSKALQKIKQRGKERQILLSQSWMSIRENGALLHP